MHSVILVKIIVCQLTLSLYLQIYRPTFVGFIEVTLIFLLFLSKTEEMCVWLIREKITLDKYRDTQSFELSYREIPVQCLLHKYTTRNQIYRKIKTLNFRYRRFLVYDKDFDDVGNA